MARFGWGDRVRDTETGLVGTVRASAPHQLLVEWDHPPMQWVSRYKFVPESRIEPLAGDAGAELSRVTDDFPEA